MSDNQATPTQAGEFRGHSVEPWRIENDRLLNRAGLPLAKIEIFTDPPDKRLLAAAPRLLRERDEARAELANANDRIATLKNLYDGVCDDARYFREERDNLRDELAKIKAERDELVILANQLLLLSYPAKDRDTCILWHGSVVTRGNIEARAIALLSRLNTQGGAQ